MTNWSFLTNHGRVLLCVADDPEIRLHDIAAELGITERHAYTVVADLTDAGYVVKTREGRRNHYEIQNHLSVSDLMDREQATRGDAERGDRSTGETEGQQRWVKD